MIKSAAKKLLSTRVRTLLRERLPKRDNLRQRFRLITIGKFEIEAPTHHPVFESHKAQPYRDLNVGIAAKYAGQKYPKSAMIDIGANIGDTAAMIASHATNDLVLVEPSDYFHGCLSRNARVFPNRTKLIKAIISGRRNISGVLDHSRTGTATIVEGEDQGLNGMQNLSLSEICDGPVCFLKVDTDGFDFEILQESKEWLASNRPAVLFESQIRTKRDRDAADRLYDTLVEIGYCRYIVWDDAGFYLLSTDSLAVLKDLNRYLGEIMRHEYRKSIFNYDVLCLQSKDEDIFQSVCGYYRSLEAA